METIWEEMRWDEEDWWPRSLNHSDARPDVTKMGIRQRSHVTIATNVNTSFMQKNVIRFLSFRVYSRYKGPPSKS